MRDLQASIEIDAPAERIAIRIEPPGGRQMEFRPTVLEVEPRRSVRWLGRFILPGSFDGEHTLAVDPMGQSAARFTQRERFSGMGREGS